MIAMLQAWSAKFFEICFTAVLKSRSSRLSLQEKRRLKVYLQNDEPFKRPELHPI
jgi:hypothetical protein